MNSTSSPFVTSLHGHPSFNPVKLGARGAALMVFMKCK